jgi:hypothetical protein
MLHFQYDEIPVGGPVAVGAVVVGAVVVGAVVVGSVVVGAVVVGAVVVGSVADDVDVDTVTVGEAGIGARVAETLVSEDPATGSPGPNFFAVGRTPGPVAVVVAGHPAGGGVIATPGGTSTLAGASTGAGMIGSASSRPRDPIHV